MTRRSVGAAPGQCRERRRYDGTSSLQVLRQARDDDGSAVGSLHGLPEAHGRPATGGGAMTRAYWRLYVVAPMAYLPAVGALAALIMGASAPAVWGVFVIAEITRQAVLA